MRTVRILSLSLLGVVALASLGADFIAPHDYAAQFREHASEGPSRSFPLGTDESGRDRLSRLLHGVRVSLLSAGFAAFAATAVGATLGVAAGYFGGKIDEIANILTNLFLSLPWLFAVLSLRALLPLNSSAWLSIAATFLLLAALGWAPGARVVRAGTARMRDSGFVLHAQAYGCSRFRLLWLHLLPNLKPIISAQFWVLLPVFLLTEANLGVLGLGIVEPVPSWGNMLADLQNYSRIPEQPWILSPAILLVLVVGSLHFAVSGAKTWE